MKLSDLKTSKFLKKEDVMNPVVVTITGFEKTNVAMEGAEPDYKWSMHVKELEKPLILNQTNGQILAAISGSDDSENWIGLKVELYNDPNIFFGGKMTGGIRVRATAEAKPVIRKPTIDTSAADDLSEYARIPKPDIKQQGYIKKICSDAFGDDKCGVANRLKIYHYNSNKWPVSEVETTTLIDTLKAAVDAFDSPDEIPF